MYTYISENQNKNVAIAISCQKLTIITSGRVIRLIFIQNIKPYTQQKICEN